MSLCMYVGCVYGCISVLLALLLLLFLRRFIFFGSEGREEVRGANISSHLRARQSSCLLPFDGYRRRGWTRYIWAGRRRARGRGGDYSCLWGPGSVLDLVIAGLGVRVGGEGGGEGEEGCLG